MIRRHATFIWILIIVAAVRFTILFLSQTHVHSDEAIIGLMGKHILEGRYFPFYMYGQPYNAGAAWEAYLAVVPFAIFGVGVIPLKSCIVVLSLIGLILFYWMCRRLYDERTAAFASVVFALAPSLLKWHFQVRGYSWYFLSIPLLTILLMSIQSKPKRTSFFFFGIVSGVSIWSLELGIAFNAALWILLLLRRGLLFKNAAIAAAGFIIGYGPAIVFNLNNHFSNWNAVFEKTGGEGFALFFQPSALRQIFLVEMPKLFGPDTVLWYYPETPASGVLFYMVALLSAGVASWPFVRSPSKIFKVIRGGLAGSAEEAGLLLLVLTFACFIPYITAPFRVPGYFLAGAFFLSALTGRLLQRCFSSPGMPVRFFGVAISAAVVITGVAAIVDIARHNQIETLTLCDRGENYCMTRVPGGDLDRVESHLRQRHVTGVWTTVSFVYPLLFECDEAFAVSDSIFGYQHHVYPEAVPWREPGREGNAVFVIETDSPFRPQLEAKFLQATQRAPRITEFGILTVIENALTNE